MTVGTFGYLLTVIFRQILVRRKYSVIFFPWFALVHQRVSRPCCLHWHPRCEVITLGEEIKILLVRFQVHPHTSEIFLIKASENCIYSLNSTLSSCSEK